LKQAFAVVSLSYTSRSIISLKSTGCTGTCSADAIAPGFDVGCVTNYVDFNITSLNESNSDAGLFEVGYARVLFDGSSNSGGIMVNTLVKPDAGVEGVLINTECQLQIAQVRYSVSVNNNGVTLLPANSQNEPIVVQYPEPEEINANGLFSSRIGGIVQVATNMYQSDIQMVLQPSLANGLQMNTTGPMSTTYLKSSISYLNAYNLTWRDPSPDIISTIRELTFRAAIANSDSSTWQNVTSSEVTVGTFYVSRYKFLGGAIVVMLLSICAIAPLFFGWWHLGRKVTLSPVEVAKSFDTPLLREGGSNMNVNDLLEHCGRKPMRYGALSAGLEEDDSGKRRGGQSSTQGKWTWRRREVQMC
jgi:hypothetical protein